MKMLAACLYLASILTDSLTLSKHAASQKHVRIPDLNTNDRLMTQKEPLDQPDSQSAEGLEPLLDVYCNLGKDFPSLTVPMGSVSPDRKQRKSPTGAQKIKMLFFSRVGKSQNPCHHFIVGGVPFTVLCALLSAESIAINKYTRRTIYIGALDSS